ncbi:MAG: ABC transporter permease [Lachnospiraceae bacterium]|nr:ABC transporter permease [Lachnospiraceae bacterium]
MKTLKKLTKRNETGILVPLVLLWLITYAANHAFFGASNMISLFRSVSISLLGAVGASFVFSCGMMDVSAGAVYGLAGMITALCMKNVGLPVVVSILLGLLSAAAIGLLNGLIINQLDIPAFIATLGTSYIARGIVNVVSKGSSVTGLPDSFNAIGDFGPFHIPWSVYIAIVVVVIAWFVFKYTIFGRSLLAAGGNAETARVCGLNIKRLRLCAFIILALLDGLAGILSTARLATAQASAGTGWEMTVIAATVIGGVSMYGGSLSIPGVVIGVTIMETLTVSMTMLKVNAYWQKIVVGAIIIFAVGIDTYRRKQLSSGKE